MQSVNQCNTHQPILCLHLRTLPQSQDMLIQPKSKEAQARAKSGARHSRYNPEFPSGENPGEEKVLLKSLYGTVAAYNLSPNTTM
jgi:hypothetical protein